MLTCYNLGCSLHTKVRLQGHDNRCSGVESMQCFQSLDCLCVYFAHPLLKSPQSLNMQPARAFLLASAALSARLLAFGFEFLHSLHARLDPSYPRKSVRARRVRPSGSDPEPDA